MGTLTVGALHVIKWVPQCYSHRINTIIQYNIGERLTEKDKTPNDDSVVLVQDDRMGFHICIVGY